MLLPEIIANAEIGPDPDVETNQASEDGLAPQLQSATVDGSTLTLAYDEELDNSGFLSSGLFTVTVNGASQSVMGTSLGGSQVSLLLSPAVEAGEAVTVGYTVPTGESDFRVQDTSGNAAASFSGREVTNNTAPSGGARSVPGESPGVPANLKVARQESGELKATWRAPSSGPAPTGYTVQWKTAADDWADLDDVSETEVTKTSHVISGLTDGTEYNVRVIATRDDVAGDPSGGVNITPQETIPPALSAAAVDGARLTLTFNEALDAGERPDKSAFAVTVGGQNRGVEAVAVLGSAVTLTLATAVSAGDSVTVAYTAPVGESEARLRDLAGNAAASFSGRSVTNSTAERATNPTTGTPTISGTAQVGETLTVGLSSISDADGMANATFSYQWLADDTAIANADAATYALTSAEQGKTIRVRVSFTDDARHAETVTSPATDAVEARPNSPATGAPAISGTAQVGETLAASTSGISDADGMANATFTYRWTANDGSSDANIPDAAGTGYTLVAVDVGKTITVEVTFTDDAGYAETLTSAATAAVAARPNSPATGLPSISGTVQVGATLTADVSGIADEDGLDSVAYSYQWRSNDGTDGTDIQDSTASTYTLVDTDEGKAISVTVTFTDDAGNAESLTSAATDAVEAKANTPATGAPAITGTVQVGETLTADTSGIADEDGLDDVAYSYQWLADGEDISGATDSTYTLASGDEGKAIKARVSFTDDAGNEESLTSAATASVAALPPEPLTAVIENAATSHDGTAFTFELRFSEEVKLSYKTLRDHAFTVAGGEVTKARRLEKRKNAGWEITISPDGDGTVTIVLPATTDCPATGAICTGDGRMLSNRLEFTVSGPGQ